jgi:hypothetical protein
MAGLSPVVMAALVAAIHVFPNPGKDVDGRDRPGHDDGGEDGPDENAA